MDDCLLTVTQQLGTCPSLTPQQGSRQLLNLVTVTNAATTNTPVTPVPRLPVITATDYTTSVVQYPHKSSKKTR